MAETGMGEREKLEIRLSGSGGQGLLLGAQILALALLKEGRQVAQSQSYEPVSRGGVSLSDLVVCRGEVDYPLITALDLVVILDQAAVGASDGLIREGALVLLDSTRAPDPPKGDFRLISLPCVERAQELGNVRAANMVAIGALAALSGICPAEPLIEAIKENSPAKFAKLNTAAINEGITLAGETAAGGG